ncbi:lipocalin-like domain-containing protein [Methylobacterium nigriterrae]|uniref:lipocalin-like domain-containing protein n=1 Tax=Methylobacterium nigriterrae TaxID=3127512 RepID=UPI003013DE6F
MNRLLVSTAVASVIVPVTAAPRVAAQSAQDIVGTWTLVSAVAVQDGARIETFGTNPTGTLMFGSNGRYALIFLRNDLPALASNNRMVGTLDENRAIAQGGIAHFGNYRVDEADRVLVFYIEKSTFPNWDGAEQRRAYALSKDELTYTSPGSTGIATKVTLQRLK